MLWKKQIKIPVKEFKGKSVAILLIPCLHNKLPEMKGHRFNTRYFSSEIYFCVYNRKVHDCLSIEQSVNLKDF